MTLYREMNWNMEKDVARAHLPSLMRVGTQATLGSLEVNGAATEASASDKEMPTSAAFRA